jgi:DNA-directed RNA polymerase alpha subunit
MLDPTPELPDDTALSNVRMPSRVRNALERAGIKSIGDLRSVSYKDLSRKRYIGLGSLAFLRRMLGVQT